MERIFPKTINRSGEFNARRDRSRFEEVILAPNTTWPHRGVCRISTNTLLISMSSSELPTSASSSNVTVGFLPSISQLYSHLFPLGTTPVSTYSTSRFESNCRDGTMILCFSVSHCLATDWFESDDNHDRHQLIAQSCSRSHSSRPTTGKSH